MKTPEIVVVKKGSSRKFVPKVNSSMENELNLLLIKVPRWKRGLAASETLIGMGGPRCQVLRSWN